MFFEIEDFAPGGTTDYTTAIQDAVAALSALGGGTLVFKQGKTYTVFTGASSQDKLMHFDSLNGITILGNGAILDSGLSDATFVTYFLLFENCSRISIHDLKVVGGNSDLDPNNGDRFIDLLQSNHVLVGNCQALNCLVGVSAQGTDQSNITIDNLYTHTTYYPLACTNVRGLRASLSTVNAGRSYFLVANCHDHDVTVDSQQGGPFTDCPLTVVADPTKSAEYNSLSNIRLNYFSRGRFPSSGDQNSNSACISIEAIQKTGTSATARFRNININFAVDCSSGDQFDSIFTMKRWTHTTTEDASTRNHEFAGITISGVAINAGNLVSSGIRLFDKMTGTAAYTNDTARAIAIRDVRIAGSPPSDAIYVNGEAAVSGVPFVVVDNVSVDGAYTTANTGSANIAVRGFKANNVSASGHVTYSPSWTATTTNPAIGNGSITGIYTRDGQSIDVTIKVTPGSTTTFGSGVYALSLPIAAASDGSSAVGAVYAFQSGVNVQAGVCRVDSGGSTMSLIMGSTSGSDWSHNTPWTFKNGDYVIATLRYRAA